MRTYSKIVAVFVISWMVYGCEPQVDVPEANAGSADFSSYVAIGASYTAGFADGALWREGQLASYPNLLAEQMQMAGGGTFNIPLLKGDKGTFPDYDPSAPNPYKVTLPRLVLVKEPDCKDEITLAPERLPGSGDDEIDIEDPSQRIAEPGLVFHHLGIPALKSFHFVYPAFGDLSSYTANLPFSPYYWRFATNPQNSRLIDEMFRAEPTFYTIEIGMSDVLSYATDGGIGKVDGQNDEDITRANTFEATVSLILDSLINQGATGVIANIPDVTRFPYFTRIEYDALELDAQEVQQMDSTYSSEGLTFTVGDNPFVVREDGAVRKIKSTEFVLLGIPTDSLKCYDLGSFIPIPDKYILSEEEIENVRTYTETFNQIIEMEAETRGIPVVDLEGFMDGIYNERTVNGIDLSAELVSGGFYSLDGLHPEERGQALIANEFIKVINKEFDAKLPLRNISDFPGALFP